MSDVKIGIIGGTGVGEQLSGGQGKRHEIETPPENWKHIVVIAADGRGKWHEIKTPFGPPSDEIFEFDWEGLPVLILGRHGPGHILPPARVPSRANIFALKTLGCTHIIATGACGSLRQEFKPGDLVIPDQIIDKTFGRPGTFFENAAVHVEFAEPFCAVMRQILITQAATGEAITAHDRGCYVCMEGPAFSTRAESLMHRLWGGDLIGMTAMPEAKLAREAEIPYALIALATDFDSWKSPASAAPGQPPAAAPSQAALLEEIKANLQAASTRAIELVRRFLHVVAADPSALTSCQAVDALKLAIWSDKSRIPPQEIQRLSPLWGKYFG